MTAAAHAVALADLALALAGTLLAERRLAAVRVRAPASGRRQTDR